MVIDFGAIFFDIAVGLGYEVPLVHREDQSFVALKRVAENLRVLIGDALGAVDNVNDQIAAIDGLERTADAEAFDAVIDPRLAPNTGGVD